MNAMLYNHIATLKSRKFKHAYLFRNYWYGNGIEHCSEKRR